MANVLRSTLTGASGADKIGTTLEFGRRPMPASAASKSPLFANLVYPGAWLLLFVVAVLAYWPGLGGPFMLDDFGSLARLGDFDGVRDWETFKAFVFGGTAGPTGRPLALLSFLVDGTNWPTDAWPFKRTNLVIHLLNGVLVGLVIRKLLEVLQYERTAVRWITLSATACWLLHPFLVSTTLYAVQRMALLSTLFMLAGILAWLHGRTRLPRDPRRAYVVMSLSLPLFAFLATISKENGILLPVLIGAIEITVFSAQRDRYGSLDRRWTGLFVALPLAVVVAYLGSRMMKPNFFDIVPPRDYSIFERLLTQPRVIVDYLQNWFLPKLYTTGVFQDHVLKSTGLFTPVTTILSLAAVLGSIGFAFWSRRRWPLVAVAILFYFANHLLESTVINLELYFEHRNYLANALLFVPLVALLWERTSPRVFTVASIGVLLMLSGFLRYSATVWQTEEGLVQASATKAPTSVRAQTRYAMLLLNAGLHDEGMQVLDEAIANIPGHQPLPQIHRMTAMCHLQTLEADEFERVAGILSSLPYDARLLRAYNEFAKTVVLKRCPAIDLEMVLPMFTRMLDVPINADPTSISYTHIKFLIGYVRLYLGQVDGAMVEFLDSLSARPGASYAMAMAAMLSTSGYPQQALHLADIALTQLDSQNNATLVGRRASEADIRAFQETVRAELEPPQGAGTPRPGE